MAPRRRPPADLQPALPLLESEQPPQPTSAPRITLEPKPACDTVSREANAGRSRKDPDSVARRRFQDPTPQIRGQWWVLRYWEDSFIAGKKKRIQRRVRLAPARMNPREVRKLAVEHLRPLNQGLEVIGSATNFQLYVENTYQPVILPLLAKSTRDRYEGVIKNYLLPEFGALCLRELTHLSLQRYFSNMATSKLAHESRDKIRDVLSSILASAVQYGLLVRNPAENLRLPAPKIGRRRIKPYVTPEQFETLLAAIPEPYQTMVFVALYTGLRISELAGLRWNDIHADSLTVDERYCRGDWGAPKSAASNATIPVNRAVIERIHRLKLLTVEVRAGRGKRRYKVVKASEPGDLVFQSVARGLAIRDNNILVRYLKPAGRRLGMPWLNWRCLRTSHATWLKLAGADIKDAQAQLRHSRASTTLDIYQQFVPESQRRVVDGLSRLVQ